MNVHLIYIPAWDICIWTLEYIIIMTVLATSSICMIVHITITNNNHMHICMQVIYIDVYMSTCNAAGNQIDSCMAIHVQMTLYTANTCTHVKLTRALDTHYAMHA